MTTDDELLAIRCQLGEPDALNALVARWHEPVWQYARRVAGSPDAADDVAQDVWMRIVRGLPRLKEPARIRAWIFGIARRVLMDRFRRQYAAPVAVELDVDHLEDPDEGAAEEQRALEADLTRMHEALSELPMTEREVLALFYLQELSLADLAEVLSVPVGTVKSRLHRARQRLRTRMAHTQESHR